MSLPRLVPAPERSLWRRVAAVALLTALVATSALVAPTAAHADRDRSAESSITALIDRERTERGLPRLTTAGDIADVAIAWSIRMSERGQLAHNPSYSDQICCWTFVSENVAMIGSVERRGGVEAALRLAHRMFMDSPPHRANILNADVNEVGVGAYLANDTLWITQNFRRHPGATPPAATPASSAETGDADADTPVSGVSKSDTRPSRPAVDPHEVQRRLAELGWYAAEVDGVVGPMTRQAVTAFHGAVGLEADGQIRAATLAALTADDPPHRSGAGGWADRSAALDALRQRMLEVRSLRGHRATSVEEHPVIVVLDRVVAAQSG